MDAQLSTQSGAWRSLANLASQLAEDFKDETLQHQVIALYVRGSHVMGYGVNQRRHAKLMSFFYDSLHAEGDLIRRFGNRLKGCKVFLYRFNNAPGSPHANQPLCAKPCLLCCHLLREVGIGKVVWITDEGRVESMKRSELPMLKENPVVLTRMFLDQAASRNHGKFIAQGHLVDE